jgi:hypothetical protein
MTNPGHYWHTDLTHRTLLTHHFLDTFDTTHILTWHIQDTSKRLMYHRHRTLHSQTDLTNKTQIYLIHTGHYSQTDLTQTDTTHTLTHRTLLKHWPDLHIYLIHNALLTHLHTGTITHTAPFTYQIKHFSYNVHGTQSTTHAEDMAH